MVRQLPTVAKRAMVILIALLMALCMFSTTAYADDTGEDTSQEVEYITNKGWFKEGVNGIYIDGYGVAMLSSSKYADPVIEYIRVHAPAIMQAARANIWGNTLECKSRKE